MSFRWIAIDDDLPARQGHVDADMIELAFVVMSMACLDHHPAGGDAREVALERQCALAHASLDRPAMAPCCEM
jgi:hypothetical protein